MIFSHWLQNAFVLTLKIPYNLNLAALAATVGYVVAAEKYRALSPHISRSYMHCSFLIHLAFTENGEIVLARYHGRAVIFQGDAVLALSKKPGRGWMMGTIAGRTGNGVYKIEFSDGSEEDGIRYRGESFRTAPSIESRDA